MSARTRNPGRVGARQRGVAGFTLIELILVLALLGLLGAVAAPRVYDAAAQAKIVATRERLQTLRRAIAGEARPGAPVVPGYRGDVGRWPGRLTDLLDRPADVPPWNPFARRGWHGPYLQADRGRAGRPPGLVDAWGHAFHYEASGGGARLASLGPDGILGTADDITVTLE